ncbi:hypothetical protein [Inquilinus sp. CA228]|uniref:hypothetical protein n=1 Tax=Inquilinus sp. CA228 TaxID=3455609 RepID=UPI003F8D01BE
MADETIFYPDDVAAAAPDRILFDLAAWPAVFLRFPELDEPRRVERVLAGFDALIGREIPFALVIRLATHDHEAEPHEAERLTNIWLKARRDPLGRFCKAMIYVTGDAAVQEAMRQRIAQVAKANPVKALHVVGDRAEGERLAAELLAAS